MRNSDVLPSPPPVLIFSHDLRPGGLSALISEQARQLRERGRPVFVVGPSPVSPDLKAVAVVFEIPFPKSIKNLLAAAKARRLLRRLIAAIRPNVLYCHGFRACLLAASLVDSPAKYFYNHGGLVDGWARTFVLRWLGSQSKKSVTNHPIPKSDWAYARYLSPIVTTTKSRVRSHPFKEVQRIGWFARFDPPKRFDLWLETYRHVRHSAPDVVGAIGGVDSEFRHMELKSLLKDDNLERFTLHGWDSPEAFFLNVDVLLAWSDSEGQLPLSTQEAIWMGIPVVTNALPGVLTFCGPDFPGLVRTPLEAAALILNLRRPDYFATFTSRQKTVFPPTYAREDIWCLE